MNVGNERRDSRRGYLQRNAIPYWHHHGALGAMGIQERVTAAECGLPAELGYEPIAGTDHE